MNLLKVRKGELVGRDGAGNSYYRAPIRRARRGQVKAGMPEHRWVVYVRSPRYRLIKGLLGGLGRGDVPTLPPAWRAWLHYTTQNPPSGTLAEQQPVAPSPYLPSGHRLAGGKRAQATGDYDAWLPNKQSMHSLPSHRPRFDGWC